MVFCQTIRMKWIVVVCIDFSKKKLHTFKNPQHRIINSKPNITKPQFLKTLEFAEKCQHFVIV